MTNNLFNAPPKLVEILEKALGIEDVKISWPYDAPAVTALSTSARFGKYKDSEKTFTSPRIDFIHDGERKFIYAPVILKNRRRETFLTSTLTWEYDFDMMQVKIIEILKRELNDR